MIHPLVSVCIPSYNQERYIESAVKSVLSQTFSDFELIIVDDCSPDQTYERLQRFSDSRIRLYRNDRNLGLEGNWNTAISKAQGTYVKLLCGDDILYPECLERQVALLRKAEKRFSGAGCHLTQHADAGGQACLQQDVFQKGHQTPGGVWRSARASAAGPTYSESRGAVLFRRELLDKTGLFDGSIPYLIDLDMWIRLLKHGDALVVTEPLFGFRVSDGSLSFFLSNRQSREFAQLIDNVRQDSSHSLSFWDALRGQIHGLLYAADAQVVLFLVCQGKIIAYAEGATIAESSE